MATWRKLIEEHMTTGLHWRRPGTGETMKDVVHCTLSDDELDTEFDDSFGCSEGKPFTLWTTKRVYFPVVYDGAEWVGSAPRDPCDEATEHAGGE